MSIGAIFRVERIYIKFNDIQLVQVFLETGFFRNPQICEQFSAVAPLAEVGAKHVARHGLPETARTRHAHETLICIDKSVDFCNEQGLVHINGVVQTYPEVRVVRIDIDTHALNI